MYPRRCWGTWACNTKRTAEGEYSFGGSHGNHMILMFSCYVSILTATRPQGVGELLTSLRFLTQWLVLCRLPDIFSIVWKNTLAVFRVKITTSYLACVNLLKFPSNSLGRKSLNVMPWKENLYSVYLGNLNWKRKSANSSSIMFLFEECSKRHKGLH